MAIAPQEFTPDITKDFYDKLARGVSERGAADVGTARSEALARGLSGDPFEASAVGSARNNTTNQLNDLNAGLNFEVAGLGRQERLTNQSRQWQNEDRLAAEAEAGLNRQLSERLARLGYSTQLDLQGRGFANDARTMPWKLGTQILSSALS